MRTKSFQLEETVPGIFLLQGCFGGILAAFVYVVASCLWDKSQGRGEFVNVSNALVLLAFFAVLTSSLGVTKAVLMWIPYRLWKVQVRTVTRVAITSLATGLFAVATGYFVGPGRPEDVTAWTLTLLLGGLPTAILVGSKAKPWELFTFGSIAGEKLRSVWGTLGTLPLRFASISALALWILSLACARHSLTLGVALTLLIHFTYLSFSTYVTFKSPRKTTLLVTGLLVNLPIACFLFFAYVDHPYAAFAPTNLISLREISAVLLVTWGIFLGVRLSVNTHPVSLIDFSESLRRAQSERDHDCLGSHFLEWQQSIA